MWQRLTDEIMNNKLRSLLVTVTLFLPFSLASAKEEHQSIDAAPDGLVIVVNTSGEVGVTGWDKNEVDVTADLGWGVEELIVERDKDDILIEVRVPKKRNSSISSDLVIRVPKNSAIDIGVVNADIEVSNVLGEQTLHSVSGDIASELDGADTEAGSVSGDIELVGSDKSIDLELSTVSGDLDVYRVSGSIEATSVSGDITVVDGAFKRVQGNTVNGSFDYKAALLDGGKLDLETINGTLDVILTGEVAARFDIETFNGSIRSCFGPKTERSNRYGPGRELQFTEGSGSARVTMKTLNGDISLCRD